MADPGGDQPAAPSAVARPDAKPAQAAAPSMKPPALTKRPGLGRNGRKIDVLCNHFGVKYGTSQDVSHYDVCVWDARSSTPGVHESFANKNMCRSIMTKLHQVYGAKELSGKRFAYDGEKSLFCAGSLPFQMQEFSVILEDAAISKVDSGTDEDPKKKRKVNRGTGGREFKVKIEYAASIKMSAIETLLKGHEDSRAQDAIRVLDIAMRQHAAAKGHLLIKENYFSPLFGVSDIGEGVQTCRGFHASFRPSIDGLSLNLDVATTTTFKPLPVLDFIKERFNPPHPRSIDWDKVKRVLKGVKVVTPHTNMVHRIIGFTDSPCSEQSFKKKQSDDDGNVSEIELSVQKYYEMQYNITIKFPELPCISAGRAKKPTLIPVELCRILEGQRYTKALSSNQRQKMIDQARQNPEERLGIVQKAMDVSEYHVDPLLRDFNIQVDKRMKKIPGRLLDAPSMRFGNQEETPRGGRWNFATKKMARGAEVRSWVIISFDGRLQPQNAENLAQNFHRICNMKGITMPTHEFILQEPRSNQHLPAAQRISDMISQAKKRLAAPPTFMLCILPGKINDIYGPLKKMLQTKNMAIVTQCMVAQRNIRDQQLTNIALKLNAKIGGYNSWLTLESDMRLPKVSRVPTIIFGMDVSHGPPGYSDAPSIAAVVASREWPNISKYGVRLKGQSRKAEMIAGLYEEASGGMIVELLRDFYSTCKTPPGVTDRRPKQIIIFRDGVSESQFDQVLRDEYLAFKKAFLHIDASGGYDPKITLIVVQKRHHTRFFPDGVAGPSMPNGNVMPGTIVDAGVCHPGDYDFYLCAHAGLIGTTRPTHYHVLVDENNFTADELQQLTHYLCYTYARSTTSISTVAPVAYAHLAATQARNFLDSEGSETSSMTGKSDRSSVIQLPELSQQMKSKMFFC